MSNDDCLKDEKKIIMAALPSRRGRYIFVLFLSIFLNRLISESLHFDALWLSTILLYMVWP